MKTINIKLNPWLAEFHKAQRHSILSGVFLQRHYKFKVSSLHQLDIDRITKELSSENPLIILTESDRAIAHRVFVHHTLWTKANRLGIATPVKSEAHVHYLGAIGASVVDEDIKVSTWVAWAKKVKNAPWGDLKDEHEFNVVIPKI